MRKVFLLTAILTAAPLSAAWVEFSPVVTASDTPISVTFITQILADCGPTQGEVTLSGTTVHVRLFRAPDVGTCPPDERPRIVTVQLGTLPVGAYTLTADYQTIHWTSRFVVRNPSAQPIAASTIGGFPMEFAPDTVSVTFGGIAASGIFPEGDHVIAKTPRHDPGLYDIELTASGGKHFVIPAGIYFFDPGVPPDTTIFEPVLFPVLDSVSGAYGSRWTSTATIQNNAGTIETFNRLDDVKCFTLPCMELRPARSSFDFAGTGFPHGALLWVPREDPGSMAFGLRIEETSKGNDPGTELMPVRESQFFRRTMMLVNVPVGQAYRTKVRIYALDPLPDPLVYIGTPLMLGEAFWSTSLRLQASPATAVPAYGEIDLSGIPKLQGLEKVTIEIYAQWGAPIWAFAAAVLNQSQRTIIITPQ